MSAMPGAPLEQHTADDDRRGRPSLRSMAPCVARSALALAALGGGLATGVTTVTAPGGFAVLRLAVLVVVGLVIGTIFGVLDARRQNERPVAGAGLRLAGAGLGLLLTPPLAAFTMTVVMFTHMSAIADGGGAIFVPLVGAAIGLVGGPWLPSTRDAPWTRGKDGILLLLAGAGLGVLMATWTLIQMTIE